MDELNAWSKNYFPDVYYDKSGNIHHRFKCMNHDVDMTIVLKNNFKTVTTVYV